MTLASIQGLPDLLPGAVMHHPGFCQAVGSSSHLRNVVEKLWPSLLREVMHRRITAILPAGMAQLCGAGLPGIALFIKKPASSPVNTGQPVLLYQKIEFLFYL